MSLKDDLIKHQIFLQRLGAQYAERLRYSLAQGIKLVLQLLEKQKKGLTKSELRGLNRELIVNMSLIKEEQLGLLIVLSLYEAEFLATVLEKNKVVKKAQIPTKAVISTKVLEKKMSVVSGEEKVTVSKAYDKFLTKKVSQIILAVGDASLEAPEDVQKVAEEKLSSLEKGLFATGALALLTTITTQAASSARQEVYIENNIPLLDWVTELDSEVCEDCEALGADSPYPADDVDIPPEHWNCRCILVPTNE